MGLLELAPKGKAHLIPITIMYDGKFYDASAYKAAPVPMALESGTVYEALRTGVSKGLFTVTGAGQLKDTWIGEGTWQVAGAAPAPKVHTVETPVMGDQDEPPKLRRPQAEKPTTPEPKAPETKPEETKPQAPAAPSNLPPQVEDKDRPVLRRGKPAPESPAAEKPVSPAGTAKTVSVAGGAKPADITGKIELLPAISDAGGPEPRPYAFDWKPEERVQFQKKILALAADAVRARAKELEPWAAEATASKGRDAQQRKLAAKPPQPTFEEVQLQAFDLSNSNEPVLVLSARASLPQRSTAVQTHAPELQYYVTLVARADLYGDLHRLFAGVTDARHLDVLPRLELIDAVDADGDGRGELLFRRIYDAGSTYSVYRVTADQLWPLFEGSVAGQ